MGENNSRRDALRLLGMLGTSWAQGRRPRHFIQTFDADLAAPAKSKARAELSASLRSPRPKASGRRTGPFAKPAKSAAPAKSRAKAAPPG
jgi:hypothetical protein